MKSLEAIFVHLEEQKLVRRLDGLPLALTTAGAYLSQTPDSFAEYLHTYENS